MSSKKHTRHRLLLDEGVHLPQQYPNLNKLHDVVHVTQARLRGAQDDKVFLHAKKENRIMVVFNVKDFKNLLETKSPSVIGLSSNLTDVQTDLKICKLLKKIKPSQLKGNLITISNSGISIKKFA